MSEEIPYLVECIVRIMNNTKFEEELLDHIEVGGGLIGKELSIFNKKLRQNYYRNYKNVFFSLKLIVTLLKLRMILKQYLTQFPNHFIVVALNNLICLERVHSDLIGSPFEYDDSHTKINTMVALATHLSYDSMMVNVSLEVKT